MTTRLTEPPERQPLPVEAARRSRGDGPSSGPERVARDTEGRPRRQGWGWPDGHGQLRLPFSAAALLVSATTGPETRKNRTTTGAAMMEGVLLLCFFGGMVFDILGS